MTLSHWHQILSKGSHEPSDGYQTISLVLVKPFWFVSWTTPYGNPAMTKVTGECKPTLNTVSLHSTTINVQMAVPASPTLTPSTPTPYEWTPPNTFGVQVIHFHLNTDNVMNGQQRLLSPDTKLSHRSPVLEG